MQKKIGVLLFSAIFYFSNTVKAQENKKIISEDFPINIEVTKELIPFKKIMSQEPQNMEERSGGKGMIEAMIVSKAVQGIMKLIDNRKKRYVSEYNYQIKNGNFYDQISVIGPLDPTGIRFKGFNIARTFQTEDNKTDTGFIAHFSIDTSKNRVLEIMNNGIFRLVLDSIHINHAKVKVPENEKTLNLDFEINFFASYAGQDGTINSEALVGKFIYSVRKAPLDKEQKDYAAYYEKRKNQECIGFGFLIPRSAGYYKRKSTNSIEKCFGQGVYSISVNVKETSKNSFVDKIIFTGSKDIITIGNATLENKFGVAPSGPVLQ